jgi:phosphate transport system permease protein
MSTDKTNTDSARIDQQALVTKANRQDLRFAVLGFVVLVIAMITLMALVLDFMIDGVPRINGDFLTNFPSRRPEQAGILSAWVGTSLVMLTTAMLAVPIGVAAGVYLEEYAPKFFDWGKPFWSPA